MTGNASSRRCPLRPEYGLVAASAGGPFSAARRAEIRILLQETLAWPLVIETARVHGVAPLCYAQLPALADAAVPADSLAALRAAAVAAAARNMQLAAKLLEINGACAGAGISLVPYKGPVLGEMAYGNLALREFADLDFILPHAELVAAWKLIEGLGYRPESPALAVSSALIPGEYAFLSAENDARLELHTERTLRHFPALPNLGPFLSRLKPVEVAGQPVATFCREDTLILLAVHGAKDYWSKLLWVCDVAWLARDPGCDWPAALERADHVRCRRMVNVALLLASTLLDAAIPGGVLAAARADARAVSQADWLAGRLFVPQPLSRLHQARYRMGMVPGLLPGIRYAARLATTPAADDWNALRLPAGLNFAYALLRPFRLLKK